MQKPWLIDIELPKAQAKELATLLVKEEKQNFNDDELTRPVKRRRIITTRAIK